MHANFLVFLFALVVFMLLISNMTLYLLYLEPLNLSITHQFGVRAICLCI